ncbi:MAG: hypothetical protein ACLQMF_18560 [Rectinemataceae bacterium]
MSADRGIPRVRLIDDSMKFSCSSGDNPPIVIDGRIALPEGDANPHLTSGVLDIWRIP